MSQHSLFAWCTGALRDSARMHGRTHDPLPWWEPATTDVMACIERGRLQAVWFCVLHERYPDCVEHAGEYALRPRRTEAA